MAIETTATFGLFLPGTGTANSHLLYNSNFTSLDSNLYATMTYSRVELVAGESTSIGEAGVIFGNMGYLAQAGTSFSPALGLYDGTVAAGVCVNIQLSGEFTYPGWNWTVNDNIFTDPTSPGALTNSNVYPNSQYMGKALAATKIILIPEQRYPNGGFFETTDEVTTTDATQTVLSTINVVNNSVVHIATSVLGLNTTDNSEGAVYSREGSYRNASGSVSLLGAVSSGHTAEDNAAWDVDMAISGVNILLRVTGAAGTTINWKSVVRKTSVL